jgi:hypothetical protein
MRFCDASDTVRSARRRRPKAPATFRPALLVMVPSKDRRQTRSMPEDGYAQMPLRACSVGLPLKQVCSGTSGSARPPSIKCVHSRASRADPMAAARRAQHRSPSRSRTAPGPTLTGQAQGPRRDKPPQQQRESANRYVKHREEPHGQRPVDSLADPSPNQGLVRCRLARTPQEIALPYCQETRPPQHGLQGDDAEKCEMQGSPPEHANKPPAAPRSPSGIATRPNTLNAITTT